MQEEMSQHKPKHDSPTILLVDATETQVMQLREAMPNWVWIEAPEGWPFEGETESAAGSFDAIIVFAYKNREARALEACRRICKGETIVGGPLLVAGTRYQMALAHEVRQLPRGHFVFTPIDENTLLDRMQKSKSLSS